jgi:predicted Zn-dependent protease
MLEVIARRFKRSVSPVKFWSLRVVEDRQQQLEVRQDVLQPITNVHRLGAFITMVDRENNMGYAATSDVSEPGLAAAFQWALKWAERAAGTHLLSPEHLAEPYRSGAYRTPVEQPWDCLSLEAKIGLLQDTCRELKIADPIIDWSVSLGYRANEVLFLTSGGVEVSQSFHYLLPGMKAVANRGDETQIRSYGYDRPVQGGLECLERLGFLAAPQQIAEEALQLLSAADCPAGRMDLLLLPGQMMLQIHESIGHPLELDRILGDERNYAGASFVTLDMFGAYRYGSELLNVTFDPSCPTQLASYGFDDEGSFSERTYLIEKGILKRPLGGLTSQLRANLLGVANSRACSWNRPPIDRMANLNLESGDERWNSW